MTALLATLILMGADYDSGSRFDYWQLPTDVAKASDYAGSATPTITDDRGVGYWTPGSDTFTRSLVYAADQLLYITVDGRMWTLNTLGGMISFGYSALDSTRITSFILSRVASDTALSIRSERVEWAYYSSDYNPDDRVIGGIEPLYAEPLGSRLGDVVEFGAW